MATLSRPVSWDSHRPIGKVLVVEPGILVRISVCKVLAESGFESIQARDGAEAVAQYQASRHGISLVILDVGMPGAQGLEAARRIRAMDPAAKIIMTDGRPGPAPVEPRPDAFLSKPFRLGPLFATLEEVLKVERRRDPHRLGLDSHPS